MDLNTYRKWLGDFAKEAQKHNVKVLSVGNEIDLHSKHFSREGNLQHKALDELIKVVRENYSGLVTYCDWDGHWNVTNINWEPMDIVFPQIYKGKVGEPASDEEYLNTLLKWKRRYLSKPLANAEFGSLSITDGERWGGAWDTPIKQPVQYDPKSQAESIDRQLRLNFMGEIYGVFLHVWNEPATGQEHDKNRLGYGIWDHVKMEPKQVFG